MLTGEECVRVGFKVWLSVGLVIGRHYHELKMATRLAELWWSAQSPAMSGKSLSRFSFSKSSSKVIISTFLEFPRKSSNDFFLSCRQALCQ